MRAILVMGHKGTYWTHTMPTAEDMEVGDMCFDYGEVGEEGFGGLEDAKDASR